MTLFTIQCNAFKNPPMTARQGRGPPNLKKKIVDCSEFPEAFLFCMIYIETGTP